MDYEDARKLTAKTKEARLNLSVGQQVKVLYVMDKEEIIGPYPKEFCDRKYIVTELAPCPSSGTSCEITTGCRGAIGLDGLSPRCYGYGDIHLIVPRKPKPLIFLKEK